MDQERCFKKRDHRECDEKPERSPFPGCGMFVQSPCHTLAEMACGYSNPNDVGEEHPPPELRLGVLTCHGFFICRVERSRGIFRDSRE